MFQIPSFEMNRNTTYNFRLILPSPTATVYKISPYRILKCILEPPLLSLEGVLLG